MPDTPSDIPEALPRIIPVDTEHFGVRLVLPLVAIIAFFIGHALSNLIFSNILSETELGCIPFITGIVFALFVAFIADKLLKRLWPSGRTLTIDTNGLVLDDRRRGQAKTIRIQWEQRINPVTWRFKVSRGSARVPKGWLMLGMRLTQDDAEITTYSFLPEKEASALPIYDKFTPLASRTVMESDDLSLREKGEQKRLLAVERERWEDGAEIRRKDFTDLITVLMTHVSDWQSGGSS